jgi:hypothetical protein
MPDFLRHHAELQAMCPQPVGIHKSLTFVELDGPVTSYILGPNHIPTHAPPCQEQLDRVQQQLTDTTTPIAVPSKNFQEFGKLT